MATQAKHPPPENFCDGKLPRQIPHSSVRVAIADDHPIALSGLESLISSEPGLEVTGKATAPEELERLLEKTPADVCVCDLILGRNEASDFLSRWTRTFPRTNFIILSMIVDPAVARSILSKGAVAYISKSDDPAEILQAIHTSSQRDIYLGRTLRDSEGLRESTVDVSALSERERHIFRLVGEGRSNKEISRKLFLSVKTVETHKEHIKNKLGFQQMQQLQAEAKNWCLGNGLRAS